MIQQFTGGPKCRSATWKISSTPWEPDWDIRNHWLLSTQPVLLFLIEVCFSILFQHLALTFLGWHKEGQWYRGRRESGKWGFFYALLGKALKYSWNYGLCKDSSVLREFLQCKADFSLHPPEQGSSILERGWRGCCIHLCWRMYFKGRSYCFLQEMS